MRRGFLLVAVCVVVIVAVGAYLVERSAPRGSSVAAACTAVNGTDTVTLSPEQARNASIIAAVAHQRGLPARAVSIALTAAIQESKLLNLHYGDSDSLGLFQQRPSQGWGSKAQVLDPVHAANAFYTALEQVSGYQTMDIGKAAQAVQRSAFPTAYELQVPAGRTLASGLTGWSTAAFSCQLDAPAEAPSHGSPASNLTSPVRAAVSTMLGPVTTTTTATTRGLVDAGGPELLLATHQNRAVTFQATGSVEPATVAGWGIASYLLANAAQLHILQVMVDGHIWTAGTASTQGWQRAAAPLAPGEVVAVVA
jgi:hypothetical protein